MAKKMIKPEEAERAGAIAEARSIYNLRLSAVAVISRQSPKNLKK